MTINQLQNELVKEIEEITKDINLINCKQEPATLKGYTQAIPIFTVFDSAPLTLEFGGWDAEIETPHDELSETAILPYFVVRVDEVEYQKQRDDMGDVNEARIMIAFAIYDDHPKLKGYYTLTSIIERVVMRFQSNPILGAFFCEKNMKVAYQEDDTFPQFFGAMEMFWILPDIGVEEIE